MEVPAGPIQCRAVASLGPLGAWGGWAQQVTARENVPAALNGRACSWQTGIVAAGAVWSLCRTGEQGCCPLPIRRA